MELSQNSPSVKKDLVNYCSLTQMLLIAFQASLNGVNHDKSICIDSAIPVLQSKLWFNVEVQLFMPIVYMCIWVCTTTDLANLFELVASLQLALQFWLQHLGPHHLAFIFEVTMTELSCKKRGKRCNKVATTAIQLSKSKKLATCYISNSCHGIMHCFSVQENMPAEDSMMPLMSHRTSSCNFDYTNESQPHGKQANANLNRGKQML